MSHSDISEVSGGPLSINTRYQIDPSLTGARLNIDYSCVPFVESSQLYCIDTASPDRTSPQYGGTDMKNMFRI